MILTSSKKYIKCFLCQWITHAKFNQCSVHQFKKEEQTLCPYNTGWSIYKWFVRLGLPPILLYCTYCLIRELGEFCNEVNIWRMIAIFVGGVLVLIGCLICLFLLLLAGISLHENFSGCGGSYWGKE